MKTKRKPYSKTLRWKEAVKNKTNWARMMWVVQLNDEFNDVKLVAEKTKLSPQRIYMILKKAREVLLDQN